MKRLSIFFTLILSTVLFSCGPSAEHKAAMQKAHDDSVKAATMEQAKKQEIMEKGKADSAQAAQRLLAKLKDDLENTKAKLESANDEMNKIKGFQIGRANAKRQEQIENQSKKIQQLNDAIAELQEKINKIQR